MTVIFSGKNVIFSPKNRSFRKLRSKNRKKDSGSGELQ